MLSTQARTRLPHVVVGFALAIASVAAAPQQPHDGNAGAQHWAYVPPQRPALPAVHDAAWVRQPIDRFVLAELEAAGLSPAPEADRETLLRRVTLALTGLPPTPADVKAFVDDQRPDAYERVVDGLLASPAHAEHLTRHWLDLARYADTHGYHIDGAREMWPWRDWVIDAFRHDMPFDRFTVEQLAGDLLPDATLQQKVATGFNRNHMTNVEGGADPEEYSVQYVVDRVDTTATVWMGLTVKCAQCHDHKYDPITQRDFYRMYALFDDVPEAGLDGYYGNAAPFVKVPSVEQSKELTELTHQLAAKAKELTDLQPSLARARQHWEEWLRAEPPVAPAEQGLLAHYPLETPQEKGKVLDASGHDHHGVIAGAGTPQWVPGRLGGGLELDGIGTHVEADDAVTFERDRPFSIGAFVKIRNGGVVVSKYSDNTGPRGVELVAMQRRLRLHLAHLDPKDALTVATPPVLDGDDWHHVAATYDGSGTAAGVRLYLDGELQPTEVEHDTLTGSIQNDEPLRIGRREVELAFQGGIDDVRVYDRVLTPGEIEGLALEPVLAAVRVPEAQRSPAQSELVASWYREHVSPTARRIREESEPLRRRAMALFDEVPSTMVMADSKTPKVAHVLIRGDYRRKGEVVEPGVPAILPQLPDGVKHDRLAFARWLIDPSNPLTARVTVNRFWAWMFGKGIVATTDDFGSRGDPPTDQPLLDWLAVEFVDSGWDVDRLLRMMVTSATFRQASRPDPENPLLAGMRRVRLEAEEVRDEALEAAGLLDRRIGGPSVMPYQPPGLWEEIAFGGQYPGQVYHESEGADRYRRGMYVFWKRSAPYASFSIFDAPTRETCTVERPSTNTPLQALVMMNDPVYVEAARALAVRMLDAGGDDVTRLQHGVLCTLNREAGDQELSVLEDELADARKTYDGDPDAAAKLLAVSDLPLPDSWPKPEVAAWTMVASLLLNTSEAITRP